ncbi:serine hydrolase domain-containing protein [Candidatus Neomarinimicrobiota bacterium]
MNRLMQAYARQDLFSGTVLVAEGDHILYTEAFGWADRQDSIPMTLDTRFRIGSISKPFTAQIINQLIAENQLSPQDTIGHLYPDYAGEGARRIIVDQLLKHTSGIIPHLSDDEEAIAEKKPHSLDDLVGYAEQSPLLFEPGSAFKYSNYGYALLAGIAVQVTRLPFYQLLESRVFKPLGLKNTGHFRSTNTAAPMAQGYEYDLLQGYLCADSIDLSYAQGYGDITSTAEDLWTWYRHLDIHASFMSIDDPVSPVTRAGWFKSTLTFPNTGKKIEVFEHSGSINGFGSYLVHAPERDIVVIVLKNFRSNNYLQPVYAPAIARELLACMYDFPVELPRKSVGLELARRIGEEQQEDLPVFYQKLKKYNSSDLNFSEPELNKLGIELLFKYERPEMAAEVFKVNMLEFPESYNTYDSYAYALLMMQDTVGAIEAYRKGFEVYDLYPAINQTESNMRNRKTATELVGTLESELVP